MNKLNAGYSKVVITPPMGINVAGYFQKRYASAVLDDLYACTLALSVEDKTVVFVNLDLISIDANGADVIRDYVSSELGLPKEAIFLSGTHTHTGPSIRLLGNSEEADNMILEYRKFLGTRCVDVACFALADLKPAKKALTPYDRW